MPGGTVPTLKGPFVLRDFGEGGFAIESRMGFTPGTRHRFDICGGRGVCVVVEAMVMHSMRIESAGEVRYLTGFAFAFPTPDERARLTLLLEELSAPA